MRPSLCLQDVAVKMILRSADARASASFMREVALLKYVSRDRNIVQFYGACITPGPEEQVWLVTEYMEASLLPPLLCHSKYHPHSAFTLYTIVNITFTDSGPSCLGSSL